jgi:hypothetical protein
MFLLFENKKLNTDPMPVALAEDELHSLRVGER